MAASDEVTKFTNQADTYSQGVADKAVNEFDNAKDTASGNTEALAEQQYNTDSSKLDQNHGDNIAKTGGNYGHLNNKDFSDTLKFMREVDAYNNKPRAQAFSVGTYRTGGIKNLGTGYERPRIETEETRELERSRTLDMNQKQLAQALQDAVNRKDYDAYIMLYKQLYGIELSRYEAEVSMRETVRSEQIREMFTKSRAAFTSYFSRIFARETVSSLYNMVKNGDSSLANALSNVMYGIPLDSLDNVVLNRAAGQIFQDALNNGHSEKEAYDMMYDFRTRLNLEQQQRNNEMEAATKANQNISNRHKDKKSGKDTVKTVRS